jgi:hypothetical protein
MHISHAPHKCQSLGRSRETESTRIAAVGEFRDLNFVFHGIVREQSLIMEAIVSFRE